MTTEQQRWDALATARAFLEALNGRTDGLFPIDGKVPGEIRKWARALLKHYPNDLWVERMQEQAESGIQRGLDQALQAVTDMKISPQSGHRQYTMAIDAVSALIPQKRRKKAKRKLE